MSLSCFILLLHNALEQTLLMPCSFPAFPNVHFAQVQSGCAAEGETPSARENKDIANVLYALSGRQVPGVGKARAVAKHILVLRPGTALCNDVMPQLRSALSKAYEASLSKTGGITLEMGVQQSHEKWAITM